MRGRRTLLLAVVAVTLLAQPVAAATTMTGGGAINEDADAAHDPFIAGEVTVSSHEMGWDSLQYEANDGTTTTLPATVNESAANPYAITFSDIETSAYGAFPVNSGTEAQESALNAAGWATDASGTAGTVSVSNTTTAPNVEAVQVSTSSQTSGDVAKASFDGFAIDSDAQKRYFSVVVDVATLDSAAHVEIRAVDSDGDYVNATIDPDENASTGTTIANSTGDGYVFQRRVGEMPVYGSGDGTMDDLNRTRVVISDADATIDIAGLNVEHTSPWTLANQQYDSADDSDSDKESTRTLTQINTSGPTSIASLSSFGSIYDAATLHDLGVEFKAYSSMMPAQDAYEVWNVTYSEASGYPSFDWLVDDYRRVWVPTAYDLSYSNLELRMAQPLPDNRYQTVEHATAVGETNFSDVSYTDATSSFTDRDSTVVLATGLSAGDKEVVHIDYLVTQAEYDNITATTVGGAPMGAADGGGIGSIPIIGGLLVTILSYFGLRGGDGGGA